MPIRARYISLIVVILGCNPPVPPTSTSLQPTTTEAPAAPSEMPSELWFPEATDLSTLPVEQQLPALNGDGGVRKQINAETRIMETWYTHDQLRERWRETIQNDEWTRHGPSIYFQQDGRYEVTQFDSGEPHGARTTYNTDGEIESTQQYENGVPQQ